MNDFLIVASRAMLGLAFAGCLVLQILLPQLAQDTGGRYWETASLVGPYATAGIAALACVQISLGIHWHLLSMVSVNSVFSAQAVPWFEALTTCLTLAAVLPAVILFHLLFMVGVGGPGVLLAFGVFVISGLSLLLLMLVLRRLLITATRHGEELGLKI